MGGGPKWETGTEVGTGNQETEQGSEELLLWLRRLRTQGVEFPLWRSGVGGVSAAPRHRFNPHPGQWVKGSGVAAAVA